jgi:rRNA maturation endonuclease Nob1
MHRQKFASIAISIPFLVLLDAHDVNMTDLASYETTQRSVTNDDDYTMRNFATQLDISQHNQSTKKKGRYCGMFSCSIKISKFQTCFHCGTFRFVVAVEIIYTSL